MDLSGSHVFGSVRRGGNLSFLDEEKKKEKKKKRKIVVNPYTDVPMLKCSVSFIIDMAFKPRHGVWHIRSRFKLFRALLKLVLWLQQRPNRLWGLPIMTCIWRCRLPKYVSSPKNIFWHLRKPTTMGPPSYSQVSLGHSNI